MSAKNEGGFLKKSVAIRRMGGKGAPVQTIPGVMGAQMQDSYMRSLGGLIVDTKHLGPTPSHFSVDRASHTERGAISHSAPHTKVSGQHYGQVLYAGAYMGDLGERIGIRA
jgi:hypothetical protein